ncbi:MAG: hypothetical protein PVSMB4_13880 [Ktedonobacterales bacterium]
MQLRTRTDTRAYRALTAVLWIAYFASAILLQRLFSLSTGQESTVVIIGSTLLIAALLHPVRRHLQESIGRRFPLHS